MEEKGIEFSIKEASQGFEYWANRIFLSEDLKARVKAADILLTPAEGFRGRPEPLFVAGTAALFQYLKNHESSLTTEICIEDSEYKEYDLHNELVRLGQVLVTYVAAPVVVGLIVEYLKGRLLGKFTKTDVQLQLTVADQNGVRQLSYKGPASDFSQTVLPALDRLTNNHTPEKLNDP